MKVIAISLVIQFIVISVGMFKDEERGAALLLSKVSSRDSGTEAGAGGSPAGGLPAEGVAKLARVTGRVHFAA